MNCECHVEDQKRSKRVEVYEQGELEALFEKDPCQMQKEREFTLSVSQPAVLQRSK